MALLLIVTNCYAFAADELTVIDIKRISHPAYRAGQQWFSVRYPWNRDDTRIMMYESRVTHPNYGTTGRGLVWGFVSELKNWATLPESQQLAAYETAAKPLPDSAHITRPTAADWSIFPGEENIIYAVYYKQSSPEKLKKINVDTNVITDVVTLGNNFRGAVIYGWTSNNTLIITTLSDKYDEVVEVDVQNKIIVNNFNTKQSVCSTEGRRWPYISHGHSARSLDRQWIISYYSGGGDSITDPWGDTKRPLYYTLKNLNSCVSFDLRTYGERDFGYASWHASNEWLIAPDYGSGMHGSPSPNIDDYGIWQVWLGNESDYHDGRYGGTDNGREGELKRKLLFYSSTAQSWREGATWDTGNLNWHAHPFPNIRKDGRQILFGSTDGKYSWEDYQKKGVTPWGYEGFFLADLDNCREVANPPVVIPGDPTEYYSLQAAYNAAGDGDTILMRAGLFTEDLYMNRPISVTIEGGYNCDYSAVIGKTTLNGDMTINDGTVTIYNSML